MEAIRRLEIPNFTLVLVGDGALGGEITKIAATSPNMFRILPFQNQTKMPIVYRVGDVLVLPSARNETWGLAVNEAIACGRRVLISDRVGCAPDVVRNRQIGDVFTELNGSDFGAKLRALLDEAGDRNVLFKEAQRFDIAMTEETLCQAVSKVLS